MKKIKLISTFLTIAIGIIIFETCKPTKILPVQTDGILRGYVYAQVINENNKVEQIYLPDVTVTIKDTSGAVLDQVLTHLDGSYATKYLKHGRYKICLTKNRFIASCYDATIQYATNHPGPLKLNYNAEKYVWGSAKLKDGSPGYYSQQVFKVNIDTKISLKAQGDSAQTRCNIFGYYIIPNTDPKETGELKANCENAEISTRLNGRKRIDLVFNNSNPKINMIVAYNDNNKTLLRTSAGTTVKLHAFTSDPDSNKLHYKWIPFGSFPGFVSEDGPDVKWVLPTKNGHYEMDLMVFDNYGGVAYKSYSIAAGDKTVNFTGIVTDIDGLGRIPNATIKVNGLYSTTSDAKGYFSIRVPENDIERYVLNVSKPGFTLCSKIYTNDAVQIEYKLVASSTQTFNPTTDIQITERPDKYTQFNGDSVKRYPAMLFIPKNSIVDSAGRLVTTPVNVSIRSMDIRKANGQMPGNFGGVSDRKNVRLESFGAVDVQVRDNANPNIKYKLAETAKAELSIPVLSSQQRRATDSIGFWDYNETTGLWDKIGKLVKAGNYYKGTTNRFSILNADFELSNGTYIVLRDNPNNTVFTPGYHISIQLFAPQSVGGVIQGYHIIDNLQPSNISFNGNEVGLPIVNLPANTVITVQIINNGTVISTLNPRTGPIIPGSAQLPPLAPDPTNYDPTAVQVFMLPDNNFINNLNLNQNQLDRFLASEQNNSDPAIAAIDADNYYALIGASNYTLNSSGTTVPAHRITFSEWKVKNGYIGINGSGDINTIYYNAGDLGFWRGMHQKTSGGVSSFYVSNFKTDADALFNNVVNNNPEPTAAKTVCMESSPIIPGGSNITKFYVFNANGDLVNDANLDQNPGPDGKKLIPGLCITCHGGAILPYQNYDVSTPANLATSQAALQLYFDGDGTAANPAHPDDIPNFLPFDAKSFYYSVASGNTRIDQEANLRALNDKVKTLESPATFTRTQAIIDFINTAYNGNTSPGGPGFIDNAVVSATEEPIATNKWTDPTLINTVNPGNFDIDIIGTSCRTCHIARNDPSLWWDTRAKIINRSLQIQGAVCPSGGNNNMPNSKVTFINFWTSEAPKRYEEIGKLLYNNATSCQ